MDILYTLARPEWSDVVWEYGSVVTFVPMLCGRECITWFYVLLQLTSSAWAERTDAGWQPPAWLVIQLYLVLSCKASVVGHLNKHLSSILEFPIQCHQRIRDGSKVNNTTSSHFGASLTSPQFTLDRGFFLDGRGSSIGLFIKSQFYGEVSTGACCGFLDVRYSKFQVMTCR